MDKPNQVATRSQQQPQQSRVDYDDQAAAVEVILGHRKKRLSAKAEALEIASWCRELRLFDADDILKAWANYQGNGASYAKWSGELIMPTIKNIRDHCLAIRKARATVEPEALLPRSDAERDEDRDIITAEAANRIMAEVGFDKEHTRRVQRFPSAPNRQRIDEIRIIDKGETHAPPPEELAAARAGNPLIQQARDMDKITKDET